MKTWILVACSSEATILTTDSLRTGELEVIREFSHPESRKKSSELVTDKQGSYRTDTEGHGSFSRKSDPKEVEAEHFAVELVHELQSGLGQNRYEKLVIVAPAHFYGLLNKHFHPPSSLEMDHVLKDYTKFAPADIHLRLKEHFGL